MKVILETERLIIREPIIEDFDAIWLMRNDPEVTFYTGGVTKLSKDDAFRLHEKRCKDFGKTPKEYSVIIKDTNQYIGYCGFQYCKVLKGIEILYGYSKEHWGNGYASEAAAVVLKFGMEVLKLNKIIAAVNPENVPSEKVLLGIGMEYIDKVEWLNQGPVKKYIINANK